MNQKNFLSDENISIKKAISLINKNGKKCILIIDKNKYLKGVLSDGDIRKSIFKGVKITSSIKKIYNKSPIKIYEEDVSYKKIFDLFKKNLIDVIPVINKDKLIKKIYTWDDILAGNIQNKFKPKKIQNCQVVILTGGLGERLKPFTNILPKALIPVDGISIIEHIIKNFNKYGIYKFNLITNYKSEIIHSYLKHNSALKKNKFIFFEESKPLGTAGGLFLIKNKIKTDFILTNCDVLIKHDFYKIFNFHKINKNDLTLVTFNKKNVLPYGDCKIDKENNLLSIQEKPTTNYIINAGIYVISPKVLKLISNNNYININDLISKMITKKLKLKVYNIDQDDWYDIGEWPQYYKTIENFN